MGDHFNDHFNVWITIRVTVSLLPLPLPFEFIARIAISSFVFVIHLFTQYQKPARQYQIIEVTTVTRPVFAASQIKTNGNSVFVFFSSIDNERIKTTDTSARVCAIQATIKLNAVVSFVLKELLRFECSYMLRYSIQMHAFILHFYIIIKEQRGAISLERQTMMAHTDVMQ